MSCISPAMFSVGEDGKSVSSGREAVCGQTINSSLAGSLPILWRVTSAKTRSVNSAAMQTAHAQMVCTRKKKKKKKIPECNSLCYILPQGNDIIQEYELGLEVHTATMQ